MNDRNTHSKQVRVVTTRAMIFEGYKNRVQNDMRQLGDACDSIDDVDTDRERASKYRTAMNIVQKIERDLGELTTEHSQDLGSNAGEDVLAVFTSASPQLEGGQAVPKNGREWVNYVRDAVKAIRADLEAYKEEHPEINRLGVRRV